MMRVVGAGLKTRPYAHEWMHAPDRDRPRGAAGRGLDGDHVHARREARGVERRHTPAGRRGAVGQHGYLAAEDVVHGHPRRAGHGDRVAHRRGARSGLGHTASIATRSAPAGAGGSFATSG